jgi:YidC/Oxa1 family membrane protein insertase
MKAVLKAIIYQPLFNILVFLIWLMPNNNLGLAIIALTVIMRLLFLPSGIKQGASQEKLRLLQPKIKELQETHKEDKTAQSKAMIDLYKQAGTSPWGACLPIIVQLIVLILLYRVFQIGLTTARFDLLYSFIPHPSTINTSFLGIDLSKPDLWILPIIAGVLQFIQSKIAMPPKSDKKSSIEENPMMAATNQMIYLFPIMTIFIARGLPSALAVYWITTSIFMIGQQYYINKVVKPRVHAQMKDLQPKTIDTLPAAAKENQTKKEPGKGVSVTIRRRK